MGTLKLSSPLASWETRLALVNSDDYPWPPSGLANTHEAAGIPSRSMADTNIVLQHSLLSSQKNELTFLLNKKKKFQNIHW